MIIQTFPSGPFATNSYIVACPQTKRAVIVDAPPESAKTLIDFCQQHDLIPEKLLLTHSHWDHIADAALLKKQLKIPVYIHTEDAGNLETPGADGLPCWIHIEEVQPDAFLKEGDSYSVGTLKFRVIETPGHTPGGVCFYFADNKKLLSGDTLFQGSIGNLSFPTARPGKMWESLKKLAKLPPDTLVYPGHGPITTIGNEPWLARAEEVFGNE